MKKNAALFSLVAGMVAVQPSQADTTNVSQDWVPATDAELNSVNQGFDTRKVRPNLPLDKKPVISRDAELRPAMEQSMTPNVISVPNALSATPPEPPFVQEVQHSPAGLRTLEEGKDKPVLLTVIAQPPSTQPAFDTRAVKEVIERWGKAWSEQNVPAYLALYSPEFRPSEAGSLPAWRSQRTSRLLRPKFIVLTLQDVRINSTEFGVTQVLFRQSYQSDLYSDAVHKQLELEKTAGGWKILRESVVP